MKNLMITISIALILTSCASSSKKEEKNPFDALTLKETLKEGLTTQTEVLKAFGAPDITTEDKTKQDVWVYSKHNVASESNGYAVGALAFLPGPFSLAGGVLDGDKSETSSKTITLTLVFNKKKILKDYSLTKVRI
ncbi:hypothetical protein C0V70_01790 [Bacteriovorax stolpii]|uniref:Uncharacterized protein n=1 Tax=Bacteriovorax stolpii TaxID=960 RepID=A0A2K9NMV5_BACTC|nr:hypothetical protein [Bacteriovorax stolpii]AUN96856.1 hypothetical protein C0V70_01790 [Bacteriovorax stolpii]TDP53134.1 hypothetical protein C8D79_1775 [Bacteriovorax stolpii]